MHHQTLWQTMGLANKRAIILHHDDLGALHAHNAAFDDLAFPTGSIMMPCTWATAWAGNTEADLGVHLTLTSEWQSPRWRPLTPSPSLCDADGYFWPTIETCWQHADIGEVEQEFRAQIELALRIGIDVTHIDTHMGTVLRPDIAQVYIRLALEYRLPAFLPNNLEQSTWVPTAFLSSLAQITANVALPTFTWVDAYALPSHERRDWFLETLRQLGPGVYHMLHHAALPTPEAQMLPDWRTREADWLALKDTEVRRVLQEECALLTYREVRDAMRK